jgi:YVTN family beta-propeller protein
MMYRHTVTIYNKLGERVAKIRDAVNLSKFGYGDYESDKYLGGPVEAAFTKDGKYLWVSNYSMVGDGFERPGCDACHGSEFDPGFLYKINTSTNEIENVVEVGAVPKFLVISEDQSKLLVSNWSSGDVSIVDLESEREVKTVKVGAHPRGIDITADSKTAFVTIMGSTKIAEIDLDSYEVSYIKDVGRSPRHLILSAHDSVMYVSLNSSNRVLKYNRFTDERTSCITSSGPRSMCLSPSEDYLYVVNYFDDSFSKIDTRNMEVVEEIKTAAKPIGICGNWDDSEIWVACYSGKIEIFKDFHLDSLEHGTSILGFDLSSFWRTTSVKKEDNEVIAEVENTETVDSMEKLEEVHEDIAEVAVKDPIIMKQKRNWLVVKSFENTASKMKVQENPQNCQYHVIAGSFSIMENAQKRQKELSGKGYPAAIISGQLNYVSAQCYNSRSEAEEGVKSIKSNTGYSAWILKR